MMKKYNKVIFLGAGFSKSICNEMPLIKDLLNDLKPGSKLNEFISNIKSKMGSEFDVENCVSYILSKEIFYSEKENIEFYNLRYELLEHIYLKIKQYKPNYNLNIMEKFIYYCIKEKVLLVTFNYDLFIENICNKMISKQQSNCSPVINYGINIKKNPYSQENIFDGELFSNKEIELLKLHGSFNWFNINHFDNANINDIIKLEEDNELSFFSDKIPYYVPMSNTKYKYFAGNFYKILWNKMKTYLDYIDEIIFIGYGFPKTDFDNLMFFINIQEKVKEIIIYNTDEDIENKERLQRIFTNAKVHTNGAIQYIESLVEDIELS